MICEFAIAVKYELKLVLQATNRT